MSAAAKGATVRFVFPEGNPPNDAELSAERFRELAAPNEVQITKLPQLSLRPRVSDYINRNFRWSYFECPEDDGNGGGVKIARSLVVVRTLPRQAIRFAFCPSAEELLDFRRWLADTVH